MENAEFCELELSLVGLKEKVCFKVPLYATIVSTTGKEQQSEHCYFYRLYSYIADFYDDDFIIITGLGKPTQLTLRLLGDINIIERTASRYRDIGSKLLHDVYGNLVQNIERNKALEEERISAVYEEWMAKDEYYSWATLCDCFRECGLNTLARDVEQYVGLPSRSLPPG